MHIDVSDTMLCYLTRKWFTSWPCVREVVRAVLREKPLIALLEPDASDAHGGCSENECRRTLLSDEYARDLKRFMLMNFPVDTWAVDWGRPELKLPTRQEIEAALFASRPIVWYRKSADFQDVSMRLICERVLHKGARPQSRYYVQGELEARLDRHPVRFARDIKLYCSQYNRGALKVAEELEKEHSSVRHTTEFDELEKCDHFLLLLSKQTWMFGCEALATEVATAMIMKKHCFLVWEMPGAASNEHPQDATPSGIGTDAHEERHACTFEELVEATPHELRKADIYHEIAMNLGGGEWRRVGLLKVIEQLAKLSDEAFSSPGLMRESTHKDHIVSMLRAFVQKSQRAWRWPEPSVLPAPESKIDRDSKGITGYSRSRRSHRVEYDCSDGNHAEELDQGASARPRGVSHRILRGTPPTARRRLTGQSAQGRFTTSSDLPFALRPGPLEHKVAVSKKTGMEHSPATDALHQSNTTAALACDELRETFVSEGSSRACHSEGRATCAVLQRGRAVDLMAPTTAAQTPTIVVSSLEESSEAATTDSSGRISFLALARASTTSGPEHPFGSGTLAAGEPRSGSLQAASQAATVSKDRVTFRV